LNLTEDEDEDGFYDFVGVHEGRVVVCVLDGTVREGGCLDGKEEL